MWVELLEGSIDEVHVACEWMMGVVKVTHSDYKDYCEAVVKHAVTSWDNSTTPKTVLDVARFMDSDPARIVGRDGGIFSNMFRFKKVFKVDDFVC
jgi:hypothetical protein